VFIEHPPVNSMASFNFTNAVLNEGTTLIFGSWVCIADGAGGFCRHLIDNMKPEASIAAQRSNLDEFIDNLDEMLLPDLARRSPLSMRLQVMLHQDFLGRSQSDLRKGIPDFHSGYTMQILSTRSSLNPSSSPYWKRAWITYSRSEMREPRMSRGPHF
jgi:hypothetical protein